MNIKIYDNGGKTIDRYTVAFLDLKLGEFTECLCTCDTGRSFWQHSECQLGRHLGKLVKFDDLPWELKGKLKLYLDDRFKN